MSRAASRTRAVVTPKQRFRHLDNSRHRARDTLALRRGRSCVCERRAAYLAFFTSPEQLLVVLAAGLAVACIWYRRRAPY
jgi:hypothetical protein